MEKKLFTTSEAAEYLTLKKSCLEAWRCRGGGPIFVKMGETWRASVRYRKEDLDAFIEMNLQTNTTRNK